MKIQCVEGDDKVSGLRVISGKKEEAEVSTQECKDSTKQETFAPADGIFVAMGTAGSAEMARQMGASLTEKGNIKVNDKMESSIPGLFAAGDCTGGLLQVAKARL